MVGLLRPAMMALALGLWACATVEDGVSGSSNEAVGLKEDSVLPNGALPPQRLREGECGLFGFSVSSRKLVFFSTEAEAKYVSADNRQLTLVPDGVFPATNYGRVTLTLGESEGLTGGLRYPSARLSDLMPDGFTRVQPIVALVTCETPDRAE